MEINMSTKQLRLGVIGMSPGNGHPYSWAAICNGYNESAMEKCGFTAIPKYLKEQNYPYDFINDAKVTHIWTQDYGLSKHIAEASNIDTCMQNFEDLIGVVDAVLLARDDAENHLRFAKPFLKAGIPIYIDKPLALSVNDAYKLLDLQSYSGQIFSCSALSYADELLLTSDELKTLGDIKTIIGFTPKGWDKYAIHAIEPMLQYISNEDEIINSSRWNANERTTLHIEFKSGIDAQISSFGECTLPIQLNLIGTQGYKGLEFSNPFQCFKKALQKFIMAASKKESELSTSKMLRVVSIIEKGRGTR